MDTEAIKQQVIDAIVKGKIQATTINIGDRIEHMHKIDKIEAGGIGFQFVNSGALTENTQPTTRLTKQAEKVDYHFCPYIQTDRLQEVGVYTPEQFNQLISQEAEKTAPQFAKFLRKHEKSGYLNFGGHNKQQIFDTLHAYYPNMKGYKYNNFSLYF